MWGWLWITFWVWAGSLVYLRGGGGHLGAGGSGARGCDHGARSDQAGGYSIGSGVGQEQGKTEVTPAGRLHLGRGLGGGLADSQALPCDPRAAASQPGVGGLCALGCDSA